MADRGQLSVAKVLGIWLAIGLGAGVLGGLEILVSSGGNVGLSLAMVGVGVLIGLLTGIIYALLYRNRLSRRSVSMAPQDWLLVAAVILLSMASRIVRLSGGPGPVHALLLGLAFIPLVALLRRRRERH